jgi:hypothetical protein
MIAEDIKADGKYNVEISATPQPIEVNHIP